MLSKKEKYKVIWSDGVIMEKKKIRSRKIVKYGMAFLIPIICIVIHMMMTDCYPFGKNTILLGDSNTLLPDHLAAGFQNLLFRGHDCIH